MKTLNKAKILSMILVLSMVIGIMPFTSTEVDAAGTKPVVTISNFEIGKKVEDLTFTVDDAHSSEYYAETDYVWDYVTDDYASDTNVFKDQKYFIGVYLKKISDHSKYGTSSEDEFKVVYRGIYGDATYETSNWSGKGHSMYPPYSTSDFKGFVNCEFTTTNYEVGKKVSDVTLTSADPSKYTAQNLIIGEKTEKYKVVIPLSGDSIFQPDETYYFSFEMVLEDGYEASGRISEDGTRFNYYINGEERQDYDKIKHWGLLSYGDLEGTATITGTAQVGETLTASVVGANADESTFTYQWYRDSIYNPITGATGKTYTILPGDLGDTFLVRIKSSHKNANQLTSTETEAVIAAEKADGPAAPAQPALKVVNNQRIEVIEVTGQEYSIDKTPWATPPNSWALHRNMGGEKAMSKAFTCRGDRPRTFPFGL